MNDDKVIELIYKAVDEINLQRSKEERLTKSIDTVLSSKSGKLDSLGFIALMVAIEERVCEELDVPLEIINENAMSQNDDPFRTIGTLVNYISTTLKNNNG